MDFNFGTSNFVTTIADNRFTFINFLIVGFNSLTPVLFMAFTNPYENLVYKNRQILTNLTA